jgi:hypothetical protein
MHVIPRCHSGTLHQPNMHDDHASTHNPRLACSQIKSAKPAIPNPNKP